MPLNQFIINDIQPFEVETPVTELQEVFNQLTYSHVPIQKDGMYLGCLSETDVYCFEANQKVSDILYAIEGFFVRDNTLWLDVLNRFAANDSNIVPVLDVDTFICKCVVESANVAHFDDRLNFFKISSHNVTKPFR